MLLITNMLQSSDHFSKCSLTVDICPSAIQGFILLACLVMVSAAWFVSY